jgi:steroid delta-isomerase-like uncharacterized protein
MSVEDTRAVVHREVEFWNTGDMAIFDEIMALNSIGHDPGGLHAGTLEQYRKNVVALLAAFGDINLVVDDLIAEGDKAAKRWTVTCTHAGDFMGIPATGKTIKFTGTNILHIVDRKIVELWGESDTLGFMQQLGAIPSLGGDE